jgi:hypothetical protein
MGLKTTAGFFEVIENREPQFENHTVDLKIRDHEDGHVIDHICLSDKDLIDAQNAITAMVNLRGLRK